MPRKGHYCFVPQCTSTSFKSPDKIFVSVPITQNVRKKWFEVVRRDLQSEPLSFTSTFHVCEDHFDLDNDVENLSYVRFCRERGMRVKIKLKDGVLPSKFECQTSRLLTEKRRKHSVAEKLNQRRIVDGSLCTPPPSSEPQTPVDCQTAPLAVLSEFEDSLCATSPVSSPIQDSQNEKGVQVCPFQIDKAVQVRPYFRSAYIQTNVKTTTVMTSPLKRPSTSSPPPRKIARHPFPLSEEESPNEELIVTSSSSFTISSTTTSSSVKALDQKQESSDRVCVMNIEKRPKLYLGINKECYFVINLLEKFTYVSSRNIMITLKKLRCNHQFAMLADDFCLSEVQVSRIFRLTLKRIVVALQQFVYFPDREAILKSLPVPFRKNFRSVVSIIDCLEIQIEKPSDPFKQALTWSSYYKCNTFKYLISCTPNGFLSFVSPGFVGRATDRDIVSMCGYLNLLKEGDQILADRGFKNLNYCLDNVGAKIIRPPSLPSGSKLSKKEAAETKQIASLRVHVERVIGRLREFKFLTPHATTDNKLVPYLDFAVICVGGLINTQSLIL